MLGFYQAIRPHSPLKGINFLSSYKNLIAYQRQTEALSKISQRMGWDQEAVMPSGALPDRVEEAAALEKILHERRASEELEGLLASVQDEHLNAIERRQLALIKRSFLRARKVPLDLSVALARITPKAHQVWANARAEDNFNSFAPVLAEVVELRREEGEALADGSDISAYDALLQDYEPDGTVADLTAMFDELRQPLVTLRTAVLERPEPEVIKGKFNPEQQILIAHELADCFGYDFSRGRIDKAVHPFSSGSGRDVRITTRTDPADPLNCFYSTIHEVGHGSYEQNIDAKYGFSPIGSGCSMGVHESQSRIYENQLARSRQFTGYLYRRMREVFGDFGLPDEHSFYQAVNRVSRGYIRTEADELQYNLHIMLRYDLERDLISGILQVPDLEAAWNERFLVDFGYEVDKASNGVLQDVHWSEGLFGYFPTYSLGNVYAGCLYLALQKDIPDLEDQISSGNLKPAVSWLKDNLQKHGNRFPARELIETTCRQTISVSPLLSYLKGKFSDLYDI